MQSGSYGEQTRGKRIWSLKRERLKSWAFVPPGEKEEAPGFFSRVLPLWKGLPVFALCFITAASRLTGDLSPLGPAIMASYMMRGEYVLFAGLGAALGAFFAGAAVQAVVILALLGLYLGLALCKIRLSDLSVLLLAGLLTLLLPLSSAQTPYEMFLAGAGALITMVLAKIYSVALAVRWRQREILSAEEIASFCLLIAGPLLALKPYSLWGISPSETLMLLCCLFAGALGGAGMGAAAGAMLGSAAYLGQNPSPHLFGGLALCGLLCGIFSRLGRLGSAAALFLGILLASALNENWFSLPMFIEAGIAVLFLLLVPQKLLRELSAHLKRDERAQKDVSVVENRVRAEIRSKLERYAEHYFSMARVINPRAVGRQYSAVGTALMAMAEESGREVKLEADKALLVSEELDRQGLLNLGVRAQSVGGELRIGIRLRRNASDALREKIAAAAARALGQSLRELPGTIDDEHSLTLGPATRYSVLVGCAQRESENGGPCGDSHLFCELPGSGYLLAISDGMGHGLRAYEESRAAIELLEDYLLAGFDPDSAILGVNDILLRRARGDMFATMDIGLIDLSTGKLKALKIGASGSYIKRGRQVLPLRGGALPMGIVEKLAPIEGETQLLDGDVLVLSSDGVPDSRERGEEWLMERIAALPLRDPAQAARQLLDEAYEGAKHPDDMTILVARIFQRR
ncbi:MAG: SpoIIE family protein phosphatase [Christensenellaceae bacterium]|jgi:hypothetical protein|nr:SpoIIE family protein phosphatase [Christensenellaceae bacterium]